MAQIFISHSSNDRAQANRLLEWLRSQGLVSTFLDFDETKGIAPGEDWERRLYREIAASDAVIALLTRNSFNSKWCFVEYAQARALGKAVIPIIETPEGETYVSDSIQHLSLVKDRAGGLERLRAQLTNIILTGTGGFPWDPKRPPYPGLMSYQEDEAAIYFGRGDDISRLVETLNRQHGQGGQKLVVVLGPSGSGKSSLLRAGLLPRLKLLAHDWIALPPFRPKRDPLAALAQAIANGANKPESWREWQTTLESGDLEHAFSDLARDLRASRLQNEAFVVVSVDQGEELFGVSDPGQAERMFAALNALLDEHLPFVVLMTLRSDYFDRLQTQQNLAAAEFEEFSLKPMPIERWRALIEQPAKVAGLVVDDELVAAAMADAHTSDALPLLAFTLRELYDRSAGAGRMTVESYRALGDAAAGLSPLENAVRRKADEVLKSAKPSPQDLEALKKAFIPAMVRVNRDGEYVRKPAPKADLPAQALPLLERLAKAYLAVIRTEENGETVVEVAHESLLRNWPLLRGWLDEEREFLIGKDQLEQDLRDWQRVQGRQKTEALLWGLKLARAQSWLAREARLTSQEQEFIRVSARHAARRRRARIMRAVGTLVGVLCILFGSAILYQVKKRQAAQAAEASALGFSASEMERNQPVSLAFLAEAMRQDRRNQSAIALAAAELSNADLPLHTLHPAPPEKGGGMEDGEFSPDGTHVVTASADGTARLWDAATGSQLGSVMRHSGWVRTAEFDSRGDLIVTASYDGSVGVWDAHSGLQQYLLTVPGDSRVKVYTAHFDKDAKTIVAAYSDGVRIWDTATRQQVGMFGIGDSVWDAVFDPSQFRRVVSASEYAANGVMVWDAKSGKATALQQGDGEQDAGSVSSVAVSADGRWIAAGSDTGKVWVWDAHTLKPACPGPLQHGDGVNSVNFNPSPDPKQKDAPILVTASRDGTARLWSLPGCQQVGESMHHAGWVRSAVFSNNGRWILTASYDRSARVWDDSGEAVTPPLRHSGAIYMAHFDPKDPHQVITASLDGTARIWRWSEPRTAPTIHGPGILEQACWDKSASRIVTVSDDAAQIWEPGKAEPSTILPVGPVSAAACSKDGQWLVTTTGTTAALWNLNSTETAPRHIELGGAPIDAKSGAGLRFDPNNRWFALISGKSITVFDLETGKPLCGPLRMDGDIVGAAFRSDGNAIAVFASDGEVRVWSLPDGKAMEPTAMKHNGRVVSAAFSPDGKLLVTASADRTARVWKVASGAEVAPRLQLDHWGTDAEFSPDGRWIVTACADFTAQVWDARTHKPTGPLLRQSAAITHVEFSPDQRWVLTYSADGTAQAWGARTGVPVTLPLRSPQPDPRYLTGAHFSPDGNWIVAFGTGAAENRGARNWQLQIEGAPITGSRVPAWLIEMAEGVGGLTIDAHGGVERAPLSEDPAILRTRLAALPGNDALSRFGRWLAADPGTRPVSPQSQP